MSRRQEQVADLVRADVSACLHREAFASPLISGLVNFTHVWISPDLRHARVFVSTMEASVEASELVDALNNERHHFQQSVSMLPTKYIPKVKFYWDETEAAARRVEDLLYKHQHHS